MDMPENLAACFGFYEQSSRFDLKDLIYRVFQEE